MCARRKPINNPVPVEERLYLSGEEESEVVDERLAEEEVVEGEEEGPAERSEPGELVRSVDEVTDRDYLVVALQLDRKHLHVHLRSKYAKYICCPASMYVG